ncbi:MAG TPA: hypothetical protein VKZ96_17715 [Thermomicrobiales bacterium]|nr:hypothetical protein [Thermomicrobiales bacterium]
MEAKTGAMISLIDANELDDEQFDDLITSINPRGSCFPAFGFLVVLALTIAMLA